MLCERSVSGAVGMCFCCCCIVALFLLVIVLMPLVCGSNSVDELIDADWLSAEEVHPTLEAASAILVRHVRGQRDDERTNATRKLSRTNHASALHTTITHTKQSRAETRKVREGVKH